MQRQSVRVVGTVLEQKVTKFKLINTLIGSGRSGAPAVLRCLVTLFLPFPPRESFTASPSLCSLWRAVIPSLKASQDLCSRYRRDFTPEPELWVICQVMRKKAHHPSWRSVTVLDVQLRFSNDNFFPMRIVKIMRILWVFVFCFLDLSGKGGLALRLFG